MPPAADSKLTSHRPHVCVCVVNSAQAFDSTMDTVTHTQTHRDRGQKEGLMTPPGSQHSQPPERVVQVQGRREGVEKAEELESVGREGWKQQGGGQ